MKKLMVAVCAAAALTGFADVDEKDSQKLEKAPAISFWGFGIYGIYSGYQLYGSLVNSEPTAQGYVEGNANIGDLGYVGLGLWSNTDLTERRKSNMSGLFNEWDFNVHFGRTFWFDNDETVGLAWRSSVVLYYYPLKNYKGSRRDHRGNRGSYTTMDFNHYFELINPIVNPYINVVREYKKGANLLQFGLKKTVAINDELSVTPYIEGVWREAQYTWCFPTDFGYSPNCNSGVATAKIGLDCNWQLTDNFGLFAKVAYCSIVDPDLRDNCDALRDLPYDWYSYGSHKDYAWGGVGVTFNF